MSEVPSEKAHISPETNLEELVAKMIERFDNASFIIFGYRDGDHIKTAMAVKDVSPKDVLCSFIETAASVSKKL